MKIDMIYYVYHNISFNAYIIMSCLDLNTCGRDQVYYNINCNFSIGYTRYMCNNIYTCQRNSGMYDCCASNITDCIVELLDVRLIPTIEPSVNNIQIDLCYDICYSMPSSSNCYWYEKQNHEVSCLNNDDKYCCSHSHLECCQPLMVYAYIIFGAIMVIPFICIWYRYSVLMYTRILPIKTNHLDQKDVISGVPSIPV